MRLPCFLKWLKVPLNHVTDRCILAYLCSLFNSRIRASTYSLHFSALRTIFDCFCGLDITENLDVSIGKKILESKYEALIKNFAATIGTIEKAHPKDGQLNPLVGLKRLNESESDGANIVTDMSSKGLSIDETVLLMNSIEKLRYRVCLFTIYSMGLRLSEGVNLQVQDIDKYRMKVHIRNGKENFKRG